MQKNKLSLRRKPKNIIQKGRYRLSTSIIATWLQDRQIFIPVKMKHRRDTQLVLVPPAGPCLTIYKAYD